MPLVSFRSKRQPVSRYPRVHTDGLLPLRALVGLRQSVRCRSLRGGCFDIVLFSYLLTVKFYALRTQPWLA